MMQLTAIILFVFVVFSDCVKLPSNFKKCNRKQPDLRDCVLKAAQHAVPQLIQPFPDINVPSLDPFELAGISIKSGQGRVAIDQNFTNCKLYGLDKVKIERFEFDFAKKTIELAGIFPEIKINAQYKVDGKFLFLPVRGQGLSIIKLKKVNATCHITYKELVKKEKTYIVIVSNQLDFEPDSVSFYFENVFDKSLSDNFNNVINDNWRAVFDDVKADYVEVIKQIFSGLLNSFFSKVSMEEAFD